MNAQNEHQAAPGLVAASESSLIRWENGSALFRVHLRRADGAIAEAHGGANEGESDQFWLLAEDRARARAAEVLQAMPPLQPGILTGPGGRESEAARPGGMQPTPPVRSAMPANQAAQAAALSNPPTDDPRRPVGTFKPSRDPEPPAIPASRDPGALPQRAANPPDRQAAASVENSASSGTSKSPAAPEDQFPGSVPSGEPFSPPSEEDPFAADMIVTGQASRGEAPTSRAPGGEGRGGEGRGAPGPQDPAAPAPAREDANKKPPGNEGAASAAPGGRPAPVPPPAQRIGETPGTWAAGNGIPAASTSINPTTNGAGPVPPREGAHIRGETGGASPVEEEPRSSRTPPTPAATRCSYPGCTLPLTRAQITVSTHKYGQALCARHLRERGGQGEG